MKDISYLWRDPETIRFPKVAVHWEKQECEDDSVAHVYFLKMDHILPGTLKGCIKAPTLTVLADFFIPNFATEYVSLAFETISDDPNTPKPVSGEIDMANGIVQIIWDRKPGKTIGWFDYESRLPKSD